jgi:hypothetical protein
MAIKPQLRAAFLCEKLGINPDGTVSALHILDAARVPAFPKLPTGETPTFNAVVLVIVENGGGAAGQVTLRLTLRYPSGRQQFLATHDVSLGQEPGEGSTTSTFLMLDVTELGTHWIDVTLDDEPLTRIPLRLYPPAIWGPRPGR